MSAFKLVTIIVYIHTQEGLIIAHIPTKQQALLVLKFVYYLASYVKVRGWIDTSRSNFSLEN